MANLVGKLLLVLIVALMSTTDAAKKPRVTNLQFYMQDILAGPNATAVQVAKRLSNYTGTDPIAALFGNVFVFDNVLTATPDPKSPVVGRTQGVVVWSSFEEYNLLTIGTYVFTSGPFNGSTFSVEGRNPYMEKVREAPVVGGTGLFRLARGYALMGTYSRTQTSQVIEYNVTIVHN
ncbi:hypothetical protein UlMin_043782 [Ulmus minor]